MADRTVSVEMQAKVGQYVAGVKEAQAVTEGLNHELKDVGKHDADFAEAVKSASELAVAFKAPTAAAGELGDKVDKSGTQMKETAVDARFLADELKKARTAALEAAAAFALTGDAAKLTEFRKQNTYANQLAGVEKALTQDARDAEAAGAKAAKEAEKALAKVAKEAEQAGKQVGTTMVKSAGGAFSEGLGGLLTNPIVLAALAPAVVEIGAGIGGLLLTGIGLAGIGAGIAGQIDDPRVQQAGSILGKDVSTGFKKATAGFAQPVADELNDLDREWAKLEPGVTATFNKLAPLVHNLGDGAAGFVDKLVPGLEDAAVAAGPLVADFAQWLPQLGSEFSDLLKTMADNSGTLEDGLNLVLGTVSALVEVSSVGVDVGSKLFELGKATTGTVAAVIDLGDASGGAYGHLDTLGDSAEQTGTKVADSVPDYQALSKSLNQVSLDADDLAGQMTDKVVNALLDADGATLHYAETQTRLAETLKQNGHAFNIHTKAGQENREMIRSSISANLAVYDSMIKSGYSAQEAAAAYDKNTAALEKQLKKAGFTAQQIQDLIGKYKKVPDNVDTEIAAHGLENAIDRLGFLLAKLNGLDGSTFGFFIHGYTEVDPIASHHDYAQGGQLPHAAQGAYYPPSGDGIVIAEEQTHGEWMIPRAGISQSRAYALGSAAMAPHGLEVGRAWRGAGSGGGGPSTLQLEATFVLPSGETVHKQLITYALNTGRAPSTLFPASTR
jgi:hypothetical protein